MPKNKIIDIDLTEEMILNPDALHPILKGFRAYRIEYGGCNEDCVYEGRILYPPEVDSTIMGYKLFEILQVPEARQELQETIERIHKKKVGKKSHWRKL